MRTMGMDDMGRNGRPQTWLRDETRAERTVKAIDGNRLTFNDRLVGRLELRCRPPSD